MKISEIRLILFHLKIYEILLPPSKSILYAFLFYHVHTKGFHGELYTYSKSVTLALGFESFDGC